MLPACRTDGELRVVEIDTAPTVVDRAQAMVIFILIACFRKVTSDEVHLLQIHATKGSEHVRFARQFPARTNP
jgi:hypothetical protein